MFGARFVRSLRTVRPVFTRNLYSPSSKAQVFIDKEERFGAHNYHPLPVVLKSGQGCVVTDVDNKEYFDFLSAYSAVNQGHRHPKIVEALIDQAQTLALTSRAFHNDTFAEYLEMATKLVGYERLLPMNTGAEAVETAVKLAKKWAYEVKGVPANQAKMVFIHGNFHGRTMIPVSASDDSECRDGFGPYLPGIELVPFDDAVALERAISDPNTAAVMLEPIQGEAGVLIPSDGYLTAVRAACTKHNVLMIADEIQTGLGRTGYMLAVEHEKVRPDIVTVGKALSGGLYPVSGVFADSEVMLTIQPGQHGSTYGGNPLANKVAIAALSALQDEGMCANAIERGEQLRRGLANMPTSVVKSHRGRGLMCAIDIDMQGDEDAAWDLCLHMAENGLLAKPTHGDRIRFTPPLVITAAQIDECLEIIHKSCVDFENDRRDKPLPIPSEVTFRKGRIIRDTP